MPTRRRTEACRVTLCWLEPALHAYEIFPRIAGPFAPVAEGTFEGRRFHVSNAMMANAAASLASEGNPNWREERIFRFKHVSRPANTAISVGLLAPPPETTISAKRPRWVTKRRSASAIEHGDNAVAAATTSCLLTRPHRCSSCRVNSRPNSSRPALLG